MFYGNFPLNLYVNPEWILIRILQMQKLKRGKEWKLSSSLKAAQLPGGDAGDATPSFTIVGETEEMLEFSGASADRITPPTHAHLQQPVNLPGLPSSRSVSLTHPGTVSDPKGNSMKRQATKPNEPTCLEAEGALVLLKSEPCRGHQSGSGVHSKSCDSRQRGRPAKCEQPSPQEEGTLESHREKTSPRSLTTTHEREPTHPAAWSGSKSLASTEHSCSAQADFQQELKV